MIKINHPFSIYLRTNHNPKNENQTFVFCNQSLCTLDELNGETQSYLKGMISKIDYSELINSRPNFKAFIYEQHRVLAFLSANEIKIHVRPLTEKVMELQAKDFNALYVNMAGFESAIPDPNNVQTVNLLNTSSHCFIADVKKGWEVNELTFVKYPIAFYLNGILYVLKLWKDDEVRDATINHWITSFKKFRPELEIAMVVPYELDFSEE